MRDVKVYDWVRKHKTDKESVRTFIGKGTLLGFGTDFVELDMGIAQFTIAIVEMENLTVKSVYINNIEFVKPIEDAVDESEKWKLG